MVESMYRKRLLPCGRCDSPMKEVAVPGDGDRVLVDICEQCSCVFIEYFDGEPSTIARALDRHRLVPGGDRRGPSERRGESAPPDCPACDQPMSLLPYLEQGPPVHRCHLCMAVLADADQLASLARYEQLQPEPQERGGLFGLLRRLFD